jgi:hypothetical protein
MKNNVKSSFNKNFKNVSKKKQAKIVIDSSKKISKNKEDEKQEKNININTNLEDNKEQISPIQEENEKDKIIHENNLSEMKELENDLEKIEKENEDVLKEITRLQEEEKDLQKEFEKIRVDIDTEKDELEDLEDINDVKSREYAHLMHIRHQQIMTMPDHEFFNFNLNGGNNMNNNETNDNSNRIFLPNIIQGLLRNNPFANSVNEDNGPPMTYNQLQALPSSNYPRDNNNHEKCDICKFEFCYNDLVTKLVKCNHTFHKECLVNRLTTMHSSKCPTCKISII